MGSPPDALYKKPVRPLARRWRWSSGWAKPSTFRSIASMAAEGSVRPKVTTSMPDGRGGSTLGVLGVPTRLKTGMRATMPYLAYRPLEAGWAESVQVASTPRRSSGVGPGACSGARSLAAEVAVVAVISVISPAPESPGPEPPGSELGSEGKIRLNRAWPLPVSYTHLTLPTN